jgi:dTMP kinase
MRGKIIALEGIDGAGKKTQAALLVKRLEERGYRTAQMDFPMYETPVGRIIKDVMSQQTTLPPRVLHMLFSANRWEVHDKIEELVGNGVIMVMNRYTASNLAYGSAKGLPRSWLESLERGLRQPDLTVVIDIDAETSLQRKPLQRDLHEGDRVFLNKVRRLFLELARQKGWVVVPGNQDKEVVHNRIWRIVEFELFRKDEASSNVL